MENVFPQLSRQSDVNSVETKIIKVSDVCSVGEDVIREFFIALWWMKLYFQISDINKAKSQLFQILRFQKPLEIRKSI